MERFIQEEQILSHDSEALMAVRRGIAHHARELGSWLLEERDQEGAAKTYWRGFAFSRDLGLLIRCPAAMLPQALRSRVKKLRTAPPPTEATD